MLSAPINFKKWIEDNRHRLKAPVCNKVIWEEGEFICMVIGGPNRRTDYHYDEGPEFFHQLEGDMVLKVMEQGIPRDIRIREGEIFLLPSRIPHSPQRLEHTVGLVIERKRLAHEQDGLMWFCEQCHHKLYEEYFHLVDIETQFPPVFERFYGSEERRRCGNCGHLNPAPTKHK
ncbi:MAG: 3-hydroxyanthranilate 3,4-dioxygenase [Gammaproteobacteria bacterium]